MYNTNTRQYTFTHVYMRQALPAATFEYKNIQKNK